MPQEKIHKNQAQKQAAYRQRRGRQKATQAQMASLAYSLHWAIESAVEYNEFPLPSELLADRPEITMKNLIRFLDPVWDPVRNPDGKHKRPPDEPERRTG